MQNKYESDNICWYKDHSVVGMPQNSVIIFQGGIQTRGVYMLSVSLSICPTRWISFVMKVPSCFLVKSSHRILPSQGILFRTGGGRWLERASPHSVSHSLIMVGRDIENLVEVEKLFVIRVKCWKLESFPDLGYFARFRCWWEDVA